jgi:hypothetical protein
MTNPIDSRRLLPPDPFATDAVPKAKTMPPDRALLPPDPFVSVPGPRVDYAQLGATMATSSVSQKLDAVRDAYAGPYQILGQTVAVAPQFRMNGGRNHADFFTSTGTLTSRGKEVHDILARAGIANPNGVMLGYGSPASLVKATQALYYAGKLPLLPAPATLADRVRKMQWDNGIGVDCVDYCLHALSQIKGRSIDALGLHAGVDPFSSTDHAKAFTHVDAQSARPGDIVALTHPTEVGHRVIVREHTVVGASDAKAAEVVRRWGTAASTFFRGAGPFHVYAVDSSWGAEDGQPFGGYRSDTWVYDAGGKSWMSYSPHTDDRGVHVSKAGPAGELLAGTYRYTGG